MTSFVTDQSNLWPKYVRFLKIQDYFDEKGALKHLFDLLDFEYGIAVVFYYAIE